MWLAVYTYVCVCVFEWLAGPVVVVAKHNTVRSLLLHWKARSVQQVAHEYTHRHTHMYSVHEICMRANTDASLDKLWQIYVYDTYFIYKPMIMLR